MALFIQSEDGSDFSPTYDDARDLPYVQNRMRS